MIEKILLISKDKLNVQEHALSTANKASISKFITKAKLYKKILKIIAVINNIFIN